MGTRGWPDKGHVHRLSAILISVASDSRSRTTFRFSTAHFLRALSLLRSNGACLLKYEISPFLSFFFLSLRKIEKSTRFDRERTFYRINRIKIWSEIKREETRDWRIVQNILLTFLGIGKLAVNAIPHKSSGEYMPVSGHASAFLSLTLKSAVMICGGINRARKRSANRDSEMSQCVLLSRFQLNEIRSSIFHTKFCVRSKERKKKRFEHKFDLLFQIRLIIFLRSK